MDTRTQTDWRVRLGTIAALLILGIIVLPAAASAHERRDLAGGKYRLVVGFLNEPSIQNQPNGLDLTVTDLTQKDAMGNGKPVEGVEKTLKAEVLVANGAKKSLTIATRFGMPGKYAAYFVPTQAGQYTYHIFGVIADQQVDEKFESGPGRFSDVEPIADLQFPNQVTVPANLQQQLDAANASANTARSFGIAGLVVGVLGLAVGGVALARRPTHRPTTGTQSSTP